jgi:hypothetical protein
MWEPRSFTTLWVSTACYRDSFTLFYHFANKATRLGRFRKLFLRVNRNLKHRIVVEIMVFRKSMLIPRFWSMISAIFIFTVEIGKVKMRSSRMAGGQSNPFWGRKTSNLITVMSHLLFKERNISDANRIISSELWASDLRFFKAPRRTAL